MSTPCGPLTSNNECTGSHSHTLATGLTSAACQTQCEAVGLSGCCLRYLTGGITNCLFYNGFYSTISNCKALLSFPNSK